MTDTDRLWRQMTNHGDMAPSHGMTCAHGNEKHMKYSGWHFASVLRTLMYL